MTPEMVEKKQEQLTLTQALRKHCTKTGESLNDFREELKKLTPEDKAWFKAQFEQEMAIIIIEPRPS